VNIEDEVERAVVACRSGRRHLQRALRPSPRGGRSASTSSCGRRIAEAGRVSEKVRLTVIGARPRRSGKRPAASESGDASASSRFT
jgi:hypothetical protein